MQIHADGEPHRGVAFVPPHRALSPRFLRRTPTIAPVENLAFVQPNRLAHAMQSNVRDKLGERLAEACEALLIMSLEAVSTLQPGRPLEHTVVRVSDFVHWARRSSDIFALPPQFPTGETVVLATPDAPLKQQAKRPDAEFIRQAELLPILPFSAAKLWRKVKNGSFSPPKKFSAGVTAWRRVAVDAWLASDSTTSTTKRKAAPR